MQSRLTENAIRHKYIAPTERPAGDFIGVEFELPILNKEKKPVDFKVIHELTDAFIHEFPFEAEKYDDDGNISSAKDRKTGDILSFDCSYNTVEFSFGKESDLHVIYDRFKKYYSFTSDFLKKNNHAITGMGINPYHEFNKNVPVPNGRYRMLLHHLKSYEKYKDLKHFHDIPNFGLLSCASQTHVDVSKNELTEAINTFNKLEPLKALLFSNSPMGEYLCARDHLWRESLHGLNPHNVDVFDKEIESVDELVSYIRSMSLYCLERDGHYINFAPTPLDLYFASDLIQGEFYNGKVYEKYTFTPEIGDLDYLRSFKFVDLTHRGTLELRSVCEQPVGEILTSQAFHAGLKKNLGTLAVYLDDLHQIYGQAYTVGELRRMFVKKNLPDFISREEFSVILTDLIDIAKEGLDRRGRDEAVFLEPLYRRAKEVLSPAREIVEGQSQGRSLEYYIDKFGEI